MLWLVVCSFAVLRVRFVCVVSLLVCLCARVFVHVCVGVCVIVFVCALVR